MNKILDFANYLCRRCGIWVIVFPDRQRLPFQNPLRLERELSFCVSADEWHNLIEKKIFYGKSENIKILKN